MSNEKNYLDPGSNSNTHNKLINNSFLTQDEEIKSIQRSIALLRQDIRKIVREEVEGAFQRN
jgi:hypothetical protein